jgi:glycosyltransferase involved in cell wall biosynthesis
MKITLISGSYPPDICGVADYTGRLHEHLQKANVHVCIFSGKEWGLSSAVHISRELSAIGSDLYHMQYPATGYGWKLGPQFLSLLRPFVITIHECSQGHILRRLSLLPFTIRARKIIFTNEYEQRYAQRFVPWIKKRSTVISIGNNIPLVSGVDKVGVRVVTYFGLIRPEKGLERLIEMGRLFKDRANGIIVRIIGTVLPGSEEYCARMRDQSKDLPIEWCLGLADEQLSYALAETEVAYLPFPDGASDRRGSLIAMLANGVAIITTKGAHTSQDLCSAVLFANSPDEAALLAETMFNDSHMRADRQQAAGLLAVKYSWANIAQKHLIIYRQLLDRTGNV